MAASVPVLHAPTTTLFRLLLGLLLGLTTLRLLGFMARFALESLQMDFAAFYTAGEALNAGLSPYRTHLATNPPIWDGINEFLTSRFLYPPLVATLFQPLARLDYFVPFLFWRRHWWAVVGYGVGGACLLAVSLGVNGIDQVRGYLQAELPRISRYGDLGAPEMLMDRAEWNALHQELAEGYTQKDSRTYLPESFFFTKNATLVRNLHSVWNKVLGAVSQSTVSLVAFGALFIGVILWEKSKGWPSAPWTAQQHFFYWQVVLLVILLTGPMTWIMNLIWLLPLALALLATTQQPLSPWQGRFVALALVGMLITALPDIHAFPLLVPFGAVLLRWHYVFAEVLILVALLLYLNSALIHHQEKSWPNVT